MVDPKGRRVGDAIKGRRVGDAIKTPEEAQRLARQMTAAAAKNTDLAPPVEYAEIGPLC